MAGLKTMHGILALIDIVNFTHQANNLEVKAVGRSQRPVPQNGRITLDTLLCGFLPPPSPFGRYRQRQRHLNTFRF